MRLGHLAAAVVLLPVGGLAACGGSGSDSADDPASDAITLGPRREAPLTDPCQWLGTEEAGAAMERVGASVGPAGVHTVTNPTGDGAAYADCWYSRGGGAVLAVTLIAEPDAVAAWRTRIETLAAHGGRDVTDHGGPQTSTRVARGSRHPARVSTGGRDQLRPQRVAG